MWNKAPTYPENWGSKQYPSDSPYFTSYNCNTLNWLAYNHYLQDIVLNEFQRLYYIYIYIIFQTVYCYMKYFILSKWYFFLLYEWILFYLSHIQHIHGWSESSLIIHSSPKQDKLWELLVRVVKKPLIN